MRRTRAEELTGATLSASKVSHQDIFDALSPEQLRQAVVQPLDTAREEFMPRFLSTSSYDDFIREMGRFIQHVKRRFLSPELEWPMDLAMDEARRLLNAAGSGPHHRPGEIFAMSMVRHGDHGGLRGVLDIVTGLLKAQALGQYLDNLILPHIRRLSVDESLALARAYLDEFDLPHSPSLDHPAAIVGRWEQVLHDHARLAIGISAAHTGVVRENKARRWRSSRASSGEESA